MELISKNKDNIHIINVPNDNFAFNFLMNGQAEIAPNDWSAFFILNKESNLQLKAAGAPLFKIPYATAIHNNWD